MRKMVFLLIAVSTMVSALPIGIFAIEDTGSFSKLIPNEMVSELTRSQIREFRDPEWGSIYVLDYRDLTGKTRVAITINREGDPIKMKVYDNDIRGEISKDKAIQTAEDYAINKDLLPMNHRKIKAVKIDDIRDYDAWFVYWEHEIKGIKIRDDHLTVKVGPKGVLGFTKRWSDIQDINLENVISKDVAISTARKKISEIEYFRKNNLMPSVKSAYLEVVPVNRYWTGNPVVWPEEKVLAYVVEMQHDGGKLEVWINAKTGEVMGGDQTRSVPNSNTFNVGLLLIFAVGSLTIFGAKRYRDRANRTS